MIWLMLVAQLVVIDSMPEDSICMERGHFPGGRATTTLIYSEPKYIDLKDETIMITHDPNYVEYLCKRCGKWIQEPMQEKPDTTVIWKRSK